MTQIKDTVWSISKWNDWKQCPASWHAKYVTREWKDFPSPQMDRGRQLHTAMEEAIKYDVSLPDELAEFAPMIQAFRRMKEDGAMVEPELKLGLSVHYKRVDFFRGERLRIRAAFDLYVEDDNRKALVIDYKGLALDTPLPTPEGWTTMGEVQEGETLLGGDGKPCRVTGKSQVSHKPCYRLRFDDTSTVVCDADHLWPVEGVGVIDTASIAAMRGMGLHLRVAVPAPLELPEKELPIDPYILGLWLGDGTRCRGTITKPDAEVWTEVQSRGCEVGVDQSYSRGMGQRTVMGLQTELRAAGLLRNKQIPQEYLRASYTQRVDLLRGLMDSDGSVNPTRKQCVFTNTDKRLSDGVLELLLTLGQRPLQSTTTQHGFGLTVTAYPISFRPVGGLQPFLLSRKAKRVGEWGGGNSQVRRVMEAVEVETVPTQCIAVDSADNTYLCTHKMLVTHNTGRPKSEHRAEAAFYGACAGVGMGPTSVQVQYIYLDQPSASFAIDVKDPSRELSDWNKRFSTADAAITGGCFDLIPGNACKWCGAFQCPRNQNEKLK